MLGARYINAILQFHNGSRVLDEVDRILDIGFSRTLSTLLGHLLNSRQTLLFSGTQTQSVSDLARLSLQDPEFINTDDRRKHTPRTPG